MATHIYLMSMKHKIVFYPTLYKKSVIHPPSANDKSGTLTATYRFGIAGFDFRPMVMEIIENQ